MRLIWWVHENRCHFASIHLFDSVSVPFERYWSDLFVRRLILLCCDRKNGRECVASELIDSCEFYTSLPCCVWYYWALFNEIHWKYCSMSLCFCSFSIQCFGIQLNFIRWCTVSNRVICDCKNGRECVASELIDPCEFSTSLWHVRILLSTLQWNTLEILFCMYLCFCSVSIQCFGILLNFMRWCTVSNRVIPSGYSVEFYLIICRIFWKHLNNSDVSFCIFKTIQSTCHDHQKDNLQKWLKVSVVLKVSETEKNASKAIFIEQLLIY